MGPVSLELRQDSSYSRGWLRRHDTSKLHSFQLLLHLQTHHDDVCQPDSQQHGVHNLPDPGDLPPLGVWIQVDSSSDHGGGFTPTVCDVGYASCGVAFGEG